MSNAHENEAQKLCLNGCFTVKPVSEFARHRGNPDGYSVRCKPCENDRLLQSRHGISWAQRDAIVAGQGGCRICRRATPNAKGWVIDHDRSCCPGDRSCGSCRRGVLCAWCNTALGYAGDDPARLRAMADYLESGERISRDISPLGGRP